MENLTYGINSYGYTRRIVYATIIGLYALSSGCAARNNYNKKDQTTVTVEDNVKVSKGIDSVVIEVENEKGEKEKTIGCQIKNPK